MSTLTTAAGRPPLTYSLPGFHSNAYEFAPEWLEKLRALEFTWVTFHPTYTVDDGHSLRIGSGPEIDQAFACARRMGFMVRMEPHLDWTATLSGGTYEWRRRMYLDPSSEYFDRVLAPLASLGPDELTLGSELDVSAYEFADRWAAVAERLRLPGTAIGHKLNHDWNTAKAAIRRELNAERASRGLQARWPVGFSHRLKSYLSTLDYVAVSFYPARSWDLDPGYTIGEFGLGSTDLARPWHFDHSTFTTPEDFALRRGFYLRFLDWLSQRTGRAASFWTAGHFDVLGIMHAEWRDDAIVEAVRNYNQASP